MITLKKKSHKEQKLFVENTMFNSYRVLVKVIAICLLFISFVDISRNQPPSFVSRNLPITLSLGYILNRIGEWPYPLFDCFTC